MTTASEDRPWWSDPDTARVRKDDLAKVEAALASMTGHYVGLYETHQNGDPETFEEVIAARAALALLAAERAERERVAAEVDAWIEKFGRFLGPPGTIG